MDAHHELEPQTKGIEGEQRANKGNDQTLNQDNGFSLPKLKHYKWWLRVISYIIFLLVGQTTVILLGRLYFDEGGKSMWMSTFAQSAGFPILLPILYFFPNPFTSQSSPSFVTLTFIYVSIGLLVTGDNMMYSYGLLYLPVSTSSLLCASQLAFSCVTSYFINSQKFTVLILNSVFILTISACLLGVNNEETTTNNVVVSKAKAIISFMCNIGASAAFALYLSLVQFSINKVIKNETFSVMLNMQFCISFVATCGCVVGLFAGGEWKTLKGEMRDYNKGSVSYIMTLVGIALSGQISTLGILGLIFEVSSLFSNVIGTLGLPLVPIFAVVFFHDKMNGVKVIALILAFWGFLSYIYQHYLDDSKATKKAAIKGSDNGNDVKGSGVEICVK